MKQFITKRLPTNPDVVADVWNIVINCRPVASSCNLGILLEKGANFCR